MVNRLSGYFICLWTLVMEERKLCVFSISFAVLLLISEKVNSSNLRETFINPLIDSNCTLADNLPCKLKSYDADCPSERGSRTEDLPLGIVTNVNLHYKYVLVKETRICEAVLHIEWQLPQLKSACNLKGFAVTLISMGGDTVNVRSCVLYDLSGATWSAGDIRHANYSCSCFRVVPGNYELRLATLGGSDVEESVFSQKIPIPVGVHENGKCRQESPPEAARSQPSLVVTPGPTTPAVNVSPVPTDMFYKGLGIGLGLLMALALAVVIYVVRVRACAPRYRPSDPDEVLIEHESSDVEPDYYHDTTRSWPGSSASWTYGGQEDSHRFPSDGPGVPPDASDDGTVAASEQMQQIADAQPVW